MKQHADKMGVPYDAYSKAVYQTIKTHGTGYVSKLTYDNGKDGVNKRYFYNERPNGSGFHSELKRSEYKTIKKDDHQGMVKLFIDKYK